MTQHKNFSTHNNLVSYIPSPTFPPNPGHRIVSSIHTSVYISKRQVLKKNPKVSNNNSLILSKVQSSKFPQLFHKIFYSFIYLFISGSREDPYLATDKNFWSLFKNIYIFLTILDHIGVAKMIVFSCTHPSGSPSDNILHNHTKGHNQETDISIMLLKL